MSCEVTVNVQESAVTVDDNVISVGVTSVASEVDVNCGGGTDEPSYTHQQNSPSSSWTVYHQLGRRPLMLIVQNNEVVEARITYPNLDSALVEFGSPQIGTAYCY